MVGVLYFVSKSHFVLPFIHFGLHTRIFWLMYFFSLALALNQLKTGDLKKGFKKWSHFLEK